MVILYFKQAWEMMKQNRLYSSMYILGTAVTIAVVMMFFIIIYIKLGPIYPEYNRNRMLYLNLIRFSINDGNNSGYSKSSYLLYDKLKAVEGCDAVTAVKTYNNKKPIPGLKNSTVLFASHTIWKVFDFDFLYGRGYTKEDEDNNKSLPVVVVSEELAHNLYATSDVVGKEVEIDGVKHKVVGVVKNVSGSTPNVYANCWVPINSSLNNEDYKRTETMLGGYKLFFLVSKNENLEAVKARISDIFFRFAQEQRQGNEYEPYINTHLKNEMGTGFGAKDTSFILLLFITLLFIPALNLSGMIASRMNSRMEEIGVRKAFGATNRSIVLQVLTENLFFTALGALLGLLLSYIVAFTSQEWIVTLFDTVNLNAHYPTTVTIEMLLNPTVILVTMLLVLLLNIISALLPAIYSLRHSITVSLNNKK